LTLEALLERADFEPFEPGEPVFREQEPASILFLLVEGRVHLERSRKFLRSVEPGELFGEESLDGERIRATTARAAVASRALPLGPALCERLRESDERFRQLIEAARRRDRVGAGDPPRVPGEARAS
jgi:CRP-like cAMP-binding protein